MGFWKVVGTIGKGALKFVGYMANEICKETMGIDFAEETKGMREAYTESTYVSKEIKELEENRDEYIKEFGREAYDAEIEFLKYEIRELADDFLENMNDGAMSAWRNSKQVQEMQTRIENMTDKQILLYLERENLSAGMRRLLRDEKNYRGL